MGQVFTKTGSICKKYNCEFAHFHCCMYLLCIGRQNIGKSGIGYSALYFCLESLYIHTLHNITSLPLYHELSVVFLHFPVLSLSPDQSRAVR